MIIYYDQIDSTNRIARELIGQGTPSGTVVHAGIQSAGKGQYGRAFNSPPGGLYFSLLLQPNLHLEYLPLVTLATGLACRNVIHSACNLQPQIKWPNDIYLGDKKIAGILCENVIGGSTEGTCPTVVIGVGINVNTVVEEFPLEIQPIVTTLFEHLNVQVDLQTLLSLLVKEIIKEVALLIEDRHMVLAHWQQHDYLQNKGLVYTAGSVTMQGTGLGLSSQGYYRILDSSGCEHAVIGGQLRPQASND